MYLINNEIIAKYYDLNLKYIDKKNMKKRN